MKQGQADILELKFERQIDSSSRPEDTQSPFPSQSPPLPAIPAAPPSLRFVPKATLKSKDMYLAETLTSNFFTSLTSLSFVASQCSDEEKEHVIASLINLVYFWRSKNNAASDVSAQINVDTCTLFYNFHGVNGTG